MATNSIIWLNLLSNLDPYFFYTANYETWKQNKKVKQQLMELNKQKQREKKARQRAKNKVDSSHSHYMYVITTSKIHVTMYDIFQATTKTL